MKISYLDIEMSLDRFSSGTGHFTQMVWAKTRFIGCGFVSYMSGKYFKQYTVCNYGPGEDLFCSNFLLIRMQKNLALVVR